MADRLCAEFDYPVGHHSFASNSTNARLFAGSLSEEDERLIATARESLARIAGALAARAPAGVPEITVQTLLGGAEIVMRSELAAGTMPSTLMPSFVFLVALPLVDQDEALELSKRTASLLEEAMT